MASRVEHGREKRHLLQDKAETGGQPPRGLLSPLGHAPFSLWSPPSP